MPAPSSDFIQKKNQEANQPVFLYSLFDYDGADSNLHYCAYPTAITYNGTTYSPFPIMHESVSENAQGQIDKTILRIGNVSRAIQGFIENFDLREKKLRIRTVFHDLLEDANAYIDEIFYVEDYTSTQDAVEFQLSSKFDILDIQLPGRVYGRNFCQWVFKSSQCGYSGGESECNKTFQRCRVLANQQRFGGFPSIPYKRLVI